jgi:hypothetical protein
MTKTIFAAAIVAAFTTPAFAEEAATFEWPEVTVGAERELEAEVNSLYASAALGPVSVGTTAKDTATSSGSFNITKYEIDISQPIGAVTLYMKNDFNDDLKHSETVVGGKISF